MTLHCPLTSHHDLLSLAAPYIIQWEITSSTSPVSFQILSPNIVSGTTASRAICPQFLIFSSISLSFKKNQCPLCLISVYSSICKQSFGLTVSVKLNYMFSHGLSSYILLKIYESNSNNGVTFLCKASLWLEVEGKRFSSNMHQYIWLIAADLLNFISKPSVKNLKASVICHAKLQASSGH